MTTDVVLLDRDGVLCVERPDYLISPEQIEFIPGSAEAVAMLTSAGWKTVVVTNQSCIGRGFVDRRSVDAVHAALREEVSRAGGCIDAILVCPHTPEDGCSCRKPLPGLILQARQSFAFDPGSTWLVGDDLRDLDAARAAGCQAALVLTGKGGRVASEARGVPKFADLYDFCCWLLQRPG